MRNIVLTNKIMKKKNVIGILNKIMEKSKDAIIKPECEIWIDRIESEYEDLNWYFENEEEWQNNFIENNSIISKRTSTSMPFKHSYLEIKKMALVRKFTKILLEK